MRYLIKKYYYSYGKRKGYVKMLIKLLKLYQTYWFVLTKYFMFCEIWGGSFYIAAALRINRFDISRKRLNGGKMHG